MAKKQQVDLDIANLEKQLATAISGAFSKASVKLGGGDFLENLTDQMNDFVKAQKAAKINEDVRAMVVKKGLDVREAELEVLTQQAVLDATRNGLGNDYVTMLSEVVKERRAQLKEEIEIEKKQKAAEEAAERLKGIDKERRELIEDIKEKQHMLKLIFTDQRVAAAYLVKQLIEGYDHIKELFSEVRKEGFTITQTFHEVGLAMSDAFSLTGASAKDSLEVMSGIRSEMGSVHHVTREARLEAASLAKTFGLTNQEAGRLTAQFATMPNATMESANNTLEFAGNLAKAAHVAPGEVMRDISQYSEEVAVNTKDGGKNIAVAAVAAKKLGMEFGSLTKMADQLLEFESSINKQMEASVLLGKEINLDKAREAALNGDLATMTQEVLANVGGEAEFNRMNVLQRKALADSLGVSVQDLAKMVKHQDELANLTEEQQMALATGETSLDEMLANSGGVASKIFDTAKFMGAAVISSGQFIKGLKTSVGFAKDLVGGFKSGAGLIEKFSGAFKKATTSGAPGPEQGPSRMASSMGKMNMGKAIQGAAATLIMAGALFVFAKALQELDKVEDMKKVAQGVLLFAGVMLSAALLLKIAGTALADPMVMLGLAVLSLAFLSLGVSMRLATPAIEAVGKVIKIVGDTIINVLKEVPTVINAVANGFVTMFTAVKDNIGSLLLLGPAFTGIAVGLGAMALAGVAAMPVIGSLIALATVAPALVGLGAAIGGLVGGGAAEEDKMDTLIGKVDQLITVVAQGGTVNMDGKKVGEIVCSYLPLSLNTSGIR